MKGQIFVITSVLVLLALFLLRVSTNTPDVAQSDSFYEDFSNLKGELVKTVDLALINGESVSSRLDDFIGFSSDVYGMRGYKESVNYTVSSGAVYLNVSLSSSSSYLTDRLIISRTVYS